MQSFSENIAQNFGHMETMSTQFICKPLKYKKYSVGFSLIAMVFTAKHSNTKS